VDLSCLHAVNAQCLCCCRREVARAICRYCTLPEWGYTCIATERLSVEALVGNSAACRTRWLDRQVSGPMRLQTDSRDKAEDQRRCRYAECIIPRIEIHLQQPYIILTTSAGTAIQTAQALRQLTLTLHTPSSPVLAHQPARLFSSWIRRGRCSVASQQFAEGD
jgi:AraC-like DNA-binding protein